MIAFDRAHLDAIDAQRQSASGAAKIARWLSLLDPRPDERILDVGCGSGAFARLLAPRVSPRGAVAGLDLSADAVALAQRRSEGFPRGRLTYQVADAQAIPFPDGCFDAAACISVLDFCDHPARVLRELCRVLRPGGRLVVASSDQDTRVFNGHQRELGRRIMRAIADRAAHPWVARDLGYLLRASGFQQRREVSVAEVERSFVAGSAGYIMAHVPRDHVLSHGEITEEEYEEWLADLDACEREGSSFYSVTTIGYVATR